MKAFVMFYNARGMNNRDDVAVDRWIVGSLSDVAGFWNQHTIAAHVRIEAVVETLEEAYSQLRQLRLMNPKE